MNDLLFVYGTLMPGHPHPMARWLAAHATDAGPATIPGALYRIQGYPGLVLDPPDGSPVYGYLYRLRTPADTLRELDRYEGCDPASPPPTEYRRVLHPVTDANGNTVTAWVYLYNGPINPDARMASGRFSEPAPDPFLRNKDSHGDPA